MNSSPSQNTSSRRLSSDPVVSPSRTPRHPQIGPVHSLASLAIAVLIVAGLSALLFPAQSLAHLVIDFGSNQREFEGQVVSGMTVLDALNASVIAGDIPLQFVIQDGEARIVEIDGYEDGKPIAVFVNGQPIDPSGIHELPIKSQDEVVIRLIEDTE